MGQDIPADPHGYLSLSPLAKSMSTDKENFATDCKEEFMRQMSVSKIFRGYSKENNYGNIEQV